MRVRRLRRFTINVFFLRLKEENDARESVESLKQRRLLNDQSVRPIKISHGEENLTSVKSVVKTRREVTLTARQGRRPFVSLTVIIFHLFLSVTRPSISKMDCARDTSGRCIRGWIVRSRAIIQRIARKRKKKKMERIWKSWSLIRLGDYPRKIDRWNEAAARPGEKSSRMGGKSGRFLVFLSSRNARGSDFRRLSLRQQFKAVRGRANDCR